MSNLPKKPIKVKASGKFLDAGTYDLVVHKFGDNTPAIVLNNNGQREAVVTVSVEGAELEPNEILVKNWGANEGIAASLVEEGLIAPTGKFIPTGYVEAQIYKWTGE